MKNGFKNVEFKDFEFPKFDEIKEGFLITAGNLKNFNTMTAGWGNFGVFWSKPSLVVYVRDTRYSYGFFNENEYFTVSFLPETMKDAINICGTLHGNEVDKVALSHLSPFEIGKSVAFEQAEKVIVCKKVLHADVVPENMDDSSFDSKIYPLKDYHRMFFGEIIKIISK